MSIYTAQNMIRVKIYPVRMVKECVNQLQFIFTIVELKETLHFDYSKTFMIYVFNLCIMYDYISDPYDILSSIYSSW